MSLFLAFKKQMNIFHFIPTKLSRLHKSTLYMAWEKLVGKMALGSLFQYFLLFMCSSLIYFAILVVKFFWHLHKVRKAVDQFPMDSKHWFWGHLDRVSVLPFFVLQLFWLDLISFFFICDVIIPAFRSWRRWTFLLQAHGWTLS